MSYEEAPATRLLATQCACCSRPLVDAESVTTGIGPICREQHGVPATLDPETRELANKLVYQIAAQQRGPEVEAALVQLIVLGCDALVARIAKRLGSDVELEWGERDLIVRAPYNAGAVAAMRSVRGRRWDGAAKVNRFPFEARLEVLRAIAAGYGEGTIVREVGRTAEPRLQPISAMVQAAEDDADDPEERERQEEQDELAEMFLRAAPAPTKLDEVTPYDALAAAACLRGQLRYHGFVQVEPDGRTREEVWELVVQPKEGKPECGHRVRVFTSIVGGQMRSTGKDAVRVVGVVTFWSKRSGSWKLCAKALARETRVHRTGTCEGIANRTLARVVTAWHACRNDADGRRPAPARESEEAYFERCETESARREEEWAHGRD